MWVALLTLFLNALDNSYHSRMTLPPQEHDKKQPVPIAVPKLLGMLKLLPGTSRASVEVECLQGSLPEISWVAMPHSGTNWEGADSQWKTGVPCTVLQSGSWDNASFPILLSRAPKNKATEAGPYTLPSSNTSNSMSVLIALETVGQAALCSQRKVISSSILVTTSSRDAEQTTTKLVAE